jgi:hypothetical protein
VLGCRSHSLVFDGYMRSLFLLLAGFVAIGALQSDQRHRRLAALVIAYGLRTYPRHPTCRSPS